MHILAARCGGAGVWLIVAARTGLCRKVQLATGWFEIGVGWTGALDEDATGKALTRRVVGARLVLRSW
jgi:hypothetical protein